MDKNKDNGKPPMWNRQILHIWVRSNEDANIVSNVVKEQPIEKILVVISIAMGSDFIFTNKMIKKPTSLIYFKHVGRHLNDKSIARILLSAYL